jgi:hypothetical protein
VGTRRRSCAVQRIAAGAVAIAAKPDLLVGIGAEEQRKTARDPE